MTRLVIGAPVLGQDGANQKVKAAFSGAEFPLTLVVTNKMTVTLSLPEAGIKLRPLGNGVATFRNFDRLQRAVSSMEQIAKLNNAKALIELDSGEDADEDADEPDQDEGGATDSEGGNQVTTEGEAGGNQGGDLTATIVQDDEKAFVVEVKGVRFEPLRNQVREDGTLTAGGLAAFEEAKAAAKATE